MSSILTGQTPAATYPGVLHIDPSLDGSLRRVYDGIGNATPIQISTDGVVIDQPLVLTQSLTINSLTSGGVESSLVPAVDNTYNLGSPSKRWANLYVSTLNFSDPVPIGSGGTGATTAAEARANLLPATAGYGNHVVQVNPAGADIEYSPFTTDQLVLTVNAQSVGGVKTFTSATIFTSISSHFIPTTTTVYDLGDGTHRWSTLYIDGINITGGITGDISPATNLAYNLGAVPSRWNTLYSNAVNTNFLGVIGAVTANLTPYVGGLGLGVTGSRWATAFIDTLTLTNPLSIANGGTGASTTSAHFVFIGPTSGGAAAPSFRALIATDIPTLDHTYISDFDTQVRTSRLDQMAAPGADVSMAGYKITNLGTPTGGNDAVTKVYADALVTGITLIKAANVATTGPLPACTYANGTLGVGATLTGDSNGALSVDSYALLLNDYVLVKDQAAPAQNGLYTQTQLGDGSHPFILTRSGGMDQAAEIFGALVPVEDSGATNYNSLWLCTTNGTVVMGTTGITFTQLNKGTDLIAGNGIDITANTVSVSGNLDSLWSLSDDEGWLHNDGAGVLSWSTPAPAGSDTYVQFNDGGVFGGVLSLAFDKTTHVLTVGSTSDTGTITVKGSIFTVGFDLTLGANGFEIQDQSGDVRFRIFEGSTNSFFLDEFLAVTSIDNKSMSFGNDSLPDSDDCGLTLEPSASGANVYVIATDCAELILRKNVGPGDLTDTIGFAWGNDKFVDWAQDNSSLVHNTYYNYTTTSSQIPQVRLTADWATQTHASRKGRYVVGVYDTTTVYNAIVADAVSGAAAVGINGSCNSSFTLTVTGHAGPAANSTYDLGVTGTRWRNAFIDTLTLTNALSLANGGTGGTSAATARSSILPAYASNTLKVLRVNAGETDVEWATAAGGSPGGSDTHVQFNNSGSFGGSANLTWDGTTLTLGAAKNLSAGGYIAGSNLNQYTAFSGPGTSTKTFTLPDATCTILTTNAAVTIGQGGTGQTTAQDARLALLPAIASNTLKVLRVNAGETDVEWAAAGGGSPGGSDTHVQFNNAGSFGGSANFTWDGTTLTLGAAKNLSAGGYIAGSNLNQYTAFAGPASSTKTFTLPDATCTILTTNAAVTIGQGGTGQTTATAAFDALSPMTTIGDTIYGGASGTRTRLAGNGTLVPMVLGMTGDGVNAAAPSWVTYVSSISNSDSTITITPTTGAAVASLNLAHANTWTAQQIFSTSAAGTTPLVARAHASQSVNIFEIQNSGGTSLCHADSSGNMFPMPLMFNLAVGTAATTGTKMTVMIVMPLPGKIVKAWIIADTAPTGADFIVDINKGDGTTQTSIWNATQANRLKLVATNKTGNQTSFDTTTFAAGDVFSIDVDQVGSTIAGQDIGVVLYCEVRNG